MADQGCSHFIWCETRAEAWHACTKCTSFSQTLTVLAGYSKHGPRTSSGRKLHFWKKKVGHHTNKPHTRFSDGSWRGNLFFLTLASPGMRLADARKQCFSLLVNCIVTSWCFRDDSLQSLLPLYNFPSFFSYFCNPNGTCMLPFLWRMPLFVLEKLVENPEMGVPTSCVSIQFCHLKKKKVKCSVPNHTTTRSHF